MPVSPTLVGLPDRDIRVVAPPSGCGLHRLHEVSVTIDVHGSLDRAKDVSPFESALVGRLLEECGRFAHADDVPLLILPEDTRCRRCVDLPGNEPPAGATDRPRYALFRLPAKADGCLRIRVPFTVATRAMRPRRPLRSRRPHVLPMAGDNVLLRALQAPPPALLGGNFRRSRSPFQPRLPRLSLTTQARQRGSVCAAFGES